MREHWTYLSSLLSVNFPPTNLTPPNNTTLLLPTAFSITSPLITTPKKLSTPLPWLSGPVPTPVSCPDLSQAVWLAARSDSETPPHSTFSTPTSVARLQVFFNFISWRGNTSVIGEESGETRVFIHTGPQLQAGWVPTLRYTSLGGAHLLRH